ncbi:MAG: diguanylate cyclase [Thiobacillus sp.]
MNKEMTTKKNTPRNTFSNSNLPLLAVGLAVLFWGADSIVDAVMFSEAHSVFESLFTPKPAELWMRCLVAAMLISFSLFAKQILARQVAISVELSQIKSQLELLVDERTKELSKANAQLRVEIGERKVIEEQLEQLAATDPLTLLLNRRKFEELLEYEIERDRRYQTGLSLVFCDIDRFKRINDEHGHDVGDGVLRLFAQTLKSSVRKSDIVARWGGEEFMLLLVNTTPEIAGVMTEQIRMEIEAFDFPAVGKVTASFGATRLLDGDNLGALIKRADVALYQAKKNGRNRVELWLG